MIDTHACGCVGPQNGEPLCPCSMRGLVKRNGRWIKPEQDMGPVRTVEKPPSLGPEYLYEKLR